ncbi:MAG: hypothetical protein ACLUL3_01580 [Romboutsia timonensis]
MSIIIMIIIFVFSDFLVRMFSSKSDIAVINMAKKALLLYVPSYYLPP